ncbi:uncharacterized protein LAJ45_07106 [Morchella importuna]|uniref:uncharacterized protein n=1 Tax=Morchella importuna TaxID=1174673 RepID=UPI001E8EB299|nr:uncharacterized protein LAJ45_07106 [Morchella importuna]KAH8148763.1 hypothetical protein LAJ45_07106 [Morchella importuna]
MSKKQSARSSKAFTPSTSSGVGGFGGFGGFDTASTFSSASASQLSYVTPPPDLKGISDSSVVVLFKNLSKKDDTTKAKALEDLQAVTDIEDAIIAAWVLLYPRLSTDTSRRVRALSHTVHGLISQRAGKRIAEYMPRVIGVWLAGLYDNDRATSKAANDALKLVFSSEEKIAKVWKAYQADIVKYCTNVVLHETVDTLSDERQVSPDDAQNKFARVIATSVLALGHLISTLPEAELKKQHDSYSAVISEPYLWSFSYHSDPYLRKALYRFLTLTLTFIPSIISSPETLPIVSEAIITKSLAKSQIGSVIDYLDALISLTSSLPTSWAVLKPSKKRTPIGMLIKFVKTGSQSAGQEYWRKLVDLISVIPREILPKSLDGIRELLVGFVDGICNGPEPRTHLISAWGAYFSVIYHILALEGGDADEAAKIIEESMWPIYYNYMLGNTDEAERMKIQYYAASICASGVAMAGVHDERIVHLMREGVWNKVENLLLERIAKGDTDGMGQKWVDLSAEILKKTKEENQVAEIVKASNVDVLLQCISAVVSEKGRSSDMSLLEQMLSNFGSSILSIQTAQQATTVFFTESLPDLLLSPSLPHILSALIAYGTHTPDFAPFETAWKKSIRSILLSTLSKETKEARIIQLLQSTPTSLQNRVPPVAELEHYVNRKLEASLETDEAAGWEMMKSSFGSSVLSEGKIMEMLVMLSDGLSLQEGRNSSSVCKHLATVAKQNPQVLVNFATSKDGADMLYRLLVLIESPESEVSDAAKSIYKVIEAGLAASNTKDQAEVVGSVVDIISKSVREPRDVELSLHALADKAKALIDRAPADEKVTLVEKLLFTPELWKRELGSFLVGAMKMSLAITNPIGGAIFFADKQKAPASTPIVRDRQGVSAAMRMGIFIIEFLKAMGSFNRSQGDVFSQISDDSRTTLFYYLALTLELAKDNVAIAGANYLWTGNLPEVEQEALEFVSDIQHFIASCFEQDDPAGYLSLVIERLMEGSMEQPASTSAFYSARALTGVIGGLADHHKVTLEQTQTWLKLCDVRRGTDVFRITAILTGLSELLEHSKDADRLRNELASDLMGVPKSKCEEEGLRKLVFLNAVLPKPGEDVAPLPPQRTILLIKHLLSWFSEKEESETEINTEVLTEAIKTFASVLPTVKELYGEHWQPLCEFVGMGISNPIVVEGCIPLIFASLKLFQTLKSIRFANDDIEEAWETTDLYPILRETLGNSRHADDQHQPRNLSNALLSRQTRSMDLKYIGDPTDIYPLLNVKSRPVQEAAFELLHRYIPSQQEHVSIEAALSKEDNFTLQLPMELLSLIMEPPTMDQVEDWDFERAMPLTLRGYLLTWILIFDHFENSSFKVRSAYVDNLKEGGYLTGLLDFAFDFLGHSKGRSIDASKFDIESYTPDLEESPLKDTQWLLIHLYYLSLRFTPSLSKSWWIDCKVRQKVLSVESFTEKYMSPLIIDKEFAAIRAWIAEQPAPAPGEEEGMQVKISRGTSKEILAVYPIDDQTMEMMVRLPSTFPLRQVEVEGVKRVGLSEQQFKKMQLASQAVINFQSASIIDGLTLFRKNVSLLFQGIAECAICYSILAVTPDRSLPNKACSTCKNKFHSSCLLKWFRTSNSSSCPLCRTSFSFYS